MKPARNVIADDPVFKERPNALQLADEIIAALNDAGYLIIPYPTSDLIRNVIFSKAPCSRYRLYDSTGLSDDVSVV